MRCLLLAMLLLPAAAHALTTRSLGHDADTHLQSVLEKARAGGFSCVVTGGSFRHDGDDATRIELRCSDGPVRSFTLGWPARDRARPIPKWFALAADDGVPAGDVAQMETLLDAAFVTDPWVPHVIREEELAVLTNDAQGLGRHDVGRTQELVLIVLLYVSFAVGLGYLWLTPARKR